MLIGPDADGPGVSIVTLFKEFVVFDVPPSYFRSSADGYFATFAAINERRRRLLLDLAEGRFCDTDGLCKTSVM